MHIRLCISMHLFLLGYTHFTYTWHKGRTGLVRLAQVNIISMILVIFLLSQVLFKMNFLTFVLCICMNRPYQFYYFVPLVSFWYLVFYSILTFPPVFNSQVKQYYS